jgi:hypothetical protein
MGGQRQRRTLQATPGLTLILPPCGSEGEVFHKALIGLVVAPAPTPGPPPTPQAACGRARSGARASSSHGGTVGHGSGTTAPGGKGAWRRKATNRATPPWCNTLTSRRRVARRVRGRPGHNAVTARSVLSGMSSSAIPPTLSSHRQPPPCGPLRGAHARAVPLPARALGDFAALCDRGAQPLPAGIPGLRRQGGQHQPGGRIALLPQGQPRALHLPARLLQGGAPAPPARAGLGPKALQRATARGPGRP